MLGLHPKLQPNTYSCGLYSVYNAMLALGIKVRLKDIDLVPHPDTGTSHNQIVLALTHLKRPLTERYYYPHTLRTKTFPIIACVDNNEHWVVIAGMVGPRWLVFDSDGKGAILLNTDELINRWRNQAGEMYGIEVS